MKHVNRVKQNTDGNGNHDPNIKIPTSTAKLPYLKDRKRYLNEAKSCKSRNVYFKKGFKGLWN